MDLNELRGQIDDIDRELVSLFCKRMDVVKSVAEYKREHNLPVLQTGRESAVLERVGKIAGEKYEDDARLLFTAMMNISKSSQHRLLDKTTKPLTIFGERKVFPKSAKVCCQGVSGAFSHRACRMLFENAEISFAEKFEDVFSAVQEGECEFGILPIENSSAGSVSQVYDLMQKYRFRIAKSVKVKIEHCLLAQSGVDISEITDVYSHPQAIAQCSDFLDAHPEIAVHSVSNTAFAAKLVSESDSRTSAAIASFECAELYNLNTLKRELQNAKSNYTRFICITSSDAMFDTPEKMSVILSLEHKAGSLYRTLSRFSYHNINLTKLESRPIPETDFEFLFYFDFEIPKNIDDVTALINELSDELDTFVFLGAYSEVK